MPRSACEVSARSRAGRMAGVFLLLVPVAAVLGAGCFGERFYDLGENHAPNTIFLDAAPYTTPPEDTLITDDRVSLYWRGTDQQDGDAIRWFYYRVSPPDTGWVQTSAGHITLSNLLDTTYTVQVYAVDDRGAADPDPATRSFRVNVFHLGHIEIPEPFVTRDSLLVFGWNISEDSELEDTDFTWQTHMVVYIPGPGEPDPIAEDWGLVPGSPDHRLTVDPVHNRRYCLTVFARYTERGDSLEARRCYTWP